MRVRSRISSIIDYFFLTPLLILRGRRFCRKHFSDESTLYVLAFQGIGDSLVTLGFLREYAERNGFQRAEVFCTKAYEELYSFYDFDFAGKTVVHPNFFKKLKRYFSTQSGLSYLLPRKNILFADAAVYLSGAWKATFRVGGISVFSYIKEAIMNLHDGADFVPPKIPEIPLSEILGNQDILGKRIAVLNTKSNTVKLENSRILFEEIASLLNGRDFLVITDLGKDSDSGAVVATHPFCGTLTQSFNLCKSASLIVGVRSGWLDLMAFTGNPIFAIYPDENEVVMNAFDLNALGRIGGKAANGNIFQCRAKDALTELRKLSC